MTGERVLLGMIHEVWISLNTRIVELDLFVPALPRLRF